MTHRINLSMTDAEYAEMMSLPVEPFPEDVWEWDITSKPPRCEQTLTRYGKLMQLARIHPDINADHFDPIRREPRFTE